MKGGFYAVFGTNLACIYDDWGKVQIERNKFFGHKTKKFPVKKQAVDFIAEGLTSVYPAIDPASFNYEALIENPLNTPISVEDLTI